MQSRGRMLFALIAGVIVVGVSVLVSYVCFRILESSASANLQEWKLGGAFAGFVFTASLLTSIVFQFYKQMTSEAVDSYRDQIRDLQAKLIKGAPCPSNFTIDIDERHKLVFARPEIWTPKGGILYQYVEPQKKDDPLPANFNVTYLPQDVVNGYLGGKFDPGNVDLEALYNQAARITVLGAQILPGYEQVGLSQEYVQVDGLKSLKVHHTCKFAHPNTPPNGPKTEMHQVYVLTYVPRRTAVFQFVFTDDTQNFLASSDVFNKVTSSIRFL